MPHRIQQFLFQSVRGRLALLVAAVAGPAFLLVALLILQSYQNERTAVASKLLSTARAISGVVDRELDESKAILKALASSGAIRRGDMPGLDAVARRTLAGDERWFVVLDPSGKVLLDTRLSPDQSTQSTEVDTEALALAENEHVSVSDLRTEKGRGTTAVRVVQPYVRDGRTDYILSLGVEPRTLAQALDVQWYAPGSIVAVLDRSGIILARSRNPEQFVGHSATPDVVKATKESQEGTVDSVTLENIPVLAAYSRSRSGWSVVIGAPKSELFASARKLLMSGLAFSVVLTLVGVLMAVWIGRALVRSVDTVSRDAEKMRRGRIPSSQSTGLEETDFVMDAMRRTAETLLRRTRTLEVVNRLNARLVAQRDPRKILQDVADAGREVSGAAIAAFYYRMENERGEMPVIYTLSRALPHADFTPDEPTRAWAVASESFHAGQAVRIPDLEAVEESKKPGFHGLPKDQALVRSYLAVPVKGRQGSVVGGLYFGHPEAGLFTQETEDVLMGLAGEAAIAMENAELYQALARELEAKSRAEAGLRLAQERLHEHAQDLERSVAERTASLREAITQMEEFSYTVSHDLRSPVRTINGYASVMLEDYGAQLDETAQDYLRRIQRASERMDQLTTDVLSYSRVARAEVKLEATDVDAIVRTLLESYEELQKQGADIQVVSPLVRVLAHEPSLRQCLANLLTNAAKFAKPGARPRIKVRTEQRADRVRIWIEDQGIGISPRFQKNLFRMFERAPTQTKYEGNGVGLAIVRKAVEKMGGSCGVESDGESGSQFWIELVAAPERPVP